MGSAAGQTINAEWWRTIDEFNAGAYAPDPASRQLVPAADLDGADADADAGDQNAIPPRAPAETPAQHTTPTDTPADGTPFEPAAKAGQAIRTRVVRLNRAAGRVPTPGGIAPLLFILIVLLWAIVPVGSAGATRLKLLWLVLTGQAGMPHVQYSANVAGAVTGGVLPSIPPGIIGGGVLPIITGGALADRQQHASTPANAGSGPGATMSSSDLLMRYGSGTSGGFQLPNMEHGSQNGNGRVY